jgi:hypothetical protein
MIQILEQLQFIDFTEQNASFKYCVFSSKCAASPARKIDFLTFNISTLYKTIKAMFPFLRIHCFFIYTSPAVIKAEEDTG